MYFTVYMVGVVIGCLLTLLGCRRRPKTIGTLRVDRSEPDEPPKLFLELYKNVGDVATKKYVTLDVSNENYISHK